MRERPNSLNHINSINRQRNSKTYDEIGVKNTDDCN